MENLKKCTETIESEKKSINCEHLFVTTSESDIISGLQWKADVSGILGDIKYLLKEYYVATFSGDDKLMLQFNNGQKFEIVVKESA